MPKNARNHARNSPFPFDDHHQNLIDPYWTWRHSPPQTASGSNQPCCHCSHVRTDRWGKRMFHSISALLAMLIDSDTLKMWNELIYSRQWLTRTLSMEIPVQWSSHLLQRRESYRNHIYNYNHNQNNLKTRSIVDSPNCTNWSPTKKDLVAG